MRKGTLEKIIARGPTNGPLHIMVSFAREKYYSSFCTVGVQKWFQHGHPMIGHPKTILLPAHNLLMACLALQRRFKARSEDT